MILALDTSTPTLKLWLDNHSWQIETNRVLARDLLKIILEKLEALEGAAPNHAGGQPLKLLSAIIVYRGPGSFTGLRIGITVANALADSLQIPIIGETGTRWREQGRERLKHDNDHLILPFYGQEAHISQPRK